MVPKKRLQVRRRVKRLKPYRGKHSPLAAAIRRNLALNIFGLASMLAGAKAGTASDSEEEEDKASEPAFITQPEVCSISNAAAEYTEAMKKVLQFAETDARDDVTDMDTTHHASGKNEVYFGTVFTDSFVESSGRWQCYAGILKDKRNKQQREHERRGHWPRMIGCPGCDLGLMLAKPARKGTVPKDPLYTTVYLDFMINSEQDCNGNSYNLVLCVGRTSYGMIRSSNCAITRLYGVVYGPLVHFMGWLKRG